MKLNLLYVTFPTCDEAEAVARALLEKGLIACVNIMAPHQALYEWDGKIEKSEEVVALFKTSPEALAQACEEIEKLHSYDAPAILEISAKSLNNAYSDWLQSAIR